VFVLPFPVVRLKCPFHDSILLVYIYSVRSKLKGLAKVGQIFKTYKDFLHIPAHSGAFPEKK
jgi:hypothetical protein